MSNDDVPVEHLSSVPHDHRDEFLRRLAYVIPYVDAAAPGTAALSKNAALFLFATIGTERCEKAPHYTTVMRWVRRYVNAGHQARFLVPNWNFAGYCRNRLPSELEDLIAQAVTKWLSPMRPTFQWVHGWLYIKVAELNSHRAADAQLRCPSRHTLTRRCHAIDPHTRALRRDGAARATRIFRIRAPARRSMPLLERVEIDHTVIDALCPSLAEPTTREAVDHERKSTRPEKP